MSVPCGSEQVGGSEIGSSGLANAESRVNGIRAGDLVALLSSRDGQTAGADITVRKGAGFPPPSHERSAVPGADPRGSDRGLSSGPDDS